jgi:hypothetical protein
MQAVVGERRDPMKFGLKREATSQAKKTTMSSMGRGIWGRLHGFGLCEGDEASLLMLINHRKPA